MKRKKNQSPHRPGSEIPIQDAHPQIPGVHTADPTTTAPTLIASAIVGFLKPDGFLG
jgi:hypothetical protein